MADRKEKTIDLGRVIKGKYGPYFSFDSKIKNVTFEREIEKDDGEKIIETVSVSVNDSGYLNSAYIQKTEDFFNFKVEKGWMEEEKANKALNTCQEKGISSFFTVKVEK